MKPPKRSKVQSICRNINERVRVAKSFRALADNYSSNEGGFRENLKQAEVIFGRAVIDQMLQENGEI